MAEGMGRRPKVDLDSGFEDMTPLVLEWLREQGVGAMIQVDAERMPFPSEAVFSV
ncbi:hypothetical protein SAMN05446589_10181 [Streptomyces sp. OV198]|nr:hypothetical protein [Streptomyces sp. OV198]SOF02937.1 hypothetical protein SAMN05446589_10181 [Streptomyces sp. OV198]